jgi:hypothetical protein
LDFNTFGNFQPIVLRYCSYRGWFVDIDSQNL